MNSISYKKRTGTSGIQGQLYETKLISLIYFRMLHDNSVEKFSLATNRDDIGAFDDICFNAKIKGFDRKPLAVFIQAKHRENDKLLTFTTKTDLTKYFDSYLEIRRAFDPSSKDMIFGGKFDETECFFVMYTTAKDDPNNKIYNGRFADYLNKLIGTGGCCRQPSYRDEDLDLLCKIVIMEQITTLAELLAKFICDNSDSEMSMNNDIMLRYHVILALNVLKVSEIQPEGHRFANFRDDFFTTDEEFLVLIKNILCLEVLKTLKLEDTDTHSLLLKFLSEPSDMTTLSKLLIGGILKYKNDKLEFVSKSITDDLKRQLDKANIPQSVVYEAAELAAKQHLLSLKLKVPASFGNKDLTIRGNDKKIEKRLSYLTTKLLDILQQSKADHIVTIDENLEEGILQLNGGLASAVGNILVYDETSKFLKFTDSCQSLENLAKRWYETLKSEIPNLYDYKLDVKVKKFPKLSFERGEFDEDLVRDFYNKLLFYTNQASQNSVEEILRAEIENHPCNDVNNFRDRSGLIYLEYHDKIQKLWMTPKEGSYLTKKSKIYQNAVSYAMSQPLIGVIRNMHNIKNQDFALNENAIKRFAMQREIIGTVIVSESCVLTVAKVKQYLGKKDHVVLDLEYIFKLPMNTHNILCKELKNSTMEMIFIAVCNQSDYRHCGKRLEDIAKAVNSKQIIVITNNMSADIMTENFSQASNVWNDDRSVFTDLSDQSQKKFLEISNIKFQGEDVSLDMMVDDKSAVLIDEDVFYKIMNNETVDIGNTIYSNYEKQFYIDRRVSRTKKQEHDKFYDMKDKILETLYDLEDDVVLITAKPRMGKSTLFTHLSLKTKERYPKAWIVRINLSEYQRIFKTYYIVLDSLRSLEFMCQAALGDESIELIGDIEIKSPNDIVYRKKDLGGNSKEFQLKMFLHYYNRGKLIFLFDGFDEMNPEYTTIFCAWLKLVNSKPRKNKIWITSSSPLSNLELLFGPSYKIENFSPLEQKSYLHIIWKFKIQFKNLNNKDIQDIEDFVDFMHRSRQKSQYLRVYVFFLEFLKMESVAAGTSFPYDEYYNNFKTRFGLCESTIPCIPDDTTPKHLYKLAENFDINVEGMDRMFYDISRGNYADF